MRTRTCSRTNPAVAGGRPVFRRFVIGSGLSLSSQASMVALGALLASTGVGATDLFRTAADAASAGSGSISGMDNNALAALSANPALLGRSEDGLQLNLSVLSADSTFRNGFGVNAKADRGPGVIPEVAFKTDLQGTGWSLAAGVNIPSGMQADFFFVDPPGTLDVSYGAQRHRAEFVVGKISGAASFAISDSLSFGLTAGLAYNRNQLEAPYIF